MTPTCRQTEALVMRVQCDFLATPGLHLTLRQAERRFGLDARTCEAVLDALVDATVLAKTPDGAYMRFIPRHAPLHAFTQHAA